jgi:hypothetical protein
MVATRQMRETNRVFVVSLFMGGVLFPLAIYGKDACDGNFYGSWHARFAFSVVKSSCAFASKKWPIGQKKVAGSVFDPML